jgi:Ca-activated chloride channel family protein
VPPTLDRSAALAAIPDAVTPRAGTSLGDAVSAAVATIAETTGNEDAAAGYPGAILLFSDGGQTDGGTSPAAAAATASIERIPIDTVTIGTRAGLVTQRLTADGFTANVHIPVPASPDTMAMLSTQTVGDAFDVTSTADVAPTLKKLLEITSRLTPFTEPARPEHDLSPIAGGAAVLAILVGIGISMRFFGRFA